MKPRLSARPAVIAAIALLYYIAGKLGLTLASINPSATSVWPPTGIALAAFLVLGLRIWPAIFLAAFLVNVTTAGSVVSSIGIAIGNTLEGVVGAALVNRFANGRQAFDRASDVFRFALLAGFLRRRSAPRSASPVSPRAASPIGQDYHVDLDHVVAGRRDRSARRRAGPGPLEPEASPDRLLGIASRFSRPESCSRLWFSSDRSCSRFPLPLASRELPARISLHSAPSLGRLPFSTPRCSDGGSPLSGIADLGNAARRRAILARDDQRVVPFPAGVHGRDRRDDSVARRRSWQTGSGSSSRWRCSSRRCTIRSKAS